VEKNTKGPQNIPNGHKAYEMVVKYSKWPKNIQAFYVQWPSKIYPNRIFCFVNVPSGDPVQQYIEKNSFFPNSWKIHSKNLLPALFLCRRLCMMA
jgi:hypothetical protein